MTAPTKASLQRELRAMTKRATFFEEQHRRTMAALESANEEYDKAVSENISMAATIENIRVSIRPVVAYMETQWPGSVGPELRRLKELCK